MPPEGQGRNRPLLTRRDQGRLLGGGGTGASLVNWVGFRQRHSREREQQEQRVGNAAEEQTVLE